jgi:hypothetical protein
VVFQRKPENEKNQTPQKSVTFTTIYLSSARLSYKMSRPTVSVFDPENADSVVSTVSLPAVFTAPIRSDVVQYVHTLMAKNGRQAYAVSKLAGHQVRTISILFCVVFLTLFVI